MTGITVGCDLMAAIALDEVMPPVAAEITAITQPALSPLYAGQTLSDIPGFSGMTALANFSSTAGQIVSATLTFTGAATDENTVLAESDLAGFSVTARDSAGNEAVFDAGQIVVSYKAIALAVSGNELEIDINPLVPDNDTLSIEIDTGPYSGTFMPRVGDLRNAAYNFMDTIAIGGTAELGEVLTAQDGLWSTSTGTLTLTRQWLRDGTAIPGATGPTYVVQEPDQGNDLTLQITGDDGVNAPVVVTSAAVSVPNAAAAVLAGTVLVDEYTDAPGSAFTIPAADLTGAAQGDQLLFCLAASDNQANWGVAGVTFDGNAASLLAESATTNPTDSQGAGAAIFGLAAPADRTGDIVVTFSEPVNRGRKLVVIKVPGASASPLDTAGNEGSGAGSDSLSFDMNVAENGLVVVACSFQEQSTTTGVTYTGLPSPTMTADSRDPGGSPGYFFEVAIAQTASAATPISLSVDRSFTRALGIAAVSLQPA